MKKILIPIITLLPAFMLSQIIIGDQIGTAADKTSVLLEFAAGQNKGIVLPYVRTLPSAPHLTEGTLVLFAKDPEKAKVMYYDGGWFDLSSGYTSDITTSMSKQPADVSENSNAKAIIGSPSSDADGVLVLESEDKAMVLPMVNSTDDVPDPAPGMMVYLSAPGAKRLAVFNGEGWTYWKPQE